MGYKIRNPYYPDTPITVRMLASHTSSINRPDFFDSFVVDSLSGLQPSLKEKLLPHGSYQTSEVYDKDHKPGEYFIYCNLGYALLGTMIEKISHQRFDKFVK